MQTEEVLYFAAILVIGVPAALRLGAWRLHVRNPTALAMVVTWFIGRAIYEEMGFVTMKARVGFDIIVIAAMFVKNDWHKGSYKTALCQFVAFVWFERSPWDRAILAMFPAVWIFYFPMIDPKPQYWILYGLSFAQLALAGWESLSTMGRTANRSHADTPEHPPPRLDFSMGRGAYG